MKKIILGAIFLMPIIANCASGPNNIKITLDAKPSTGYSWQSKCNPKNGATIQGPAEQNDTSTKSSAKSVGASNEQVYTITKNTKKPVTCTFTYSRPWEKDATPAQQFSIKL